MKKNNEPIVYRGEIYYADLSPAFGSEQGGLRPVLIIQNDVGNRHAPTTIAAPITSRLTKKPLPTHVLLEVGTCGLQYESVVLMEQIRTLDKRRLKTRLGKIPTEKWPEINKAIKTSLELD